MQCRALTGDLVLPYHAHLAPWRKIPRVLQVDREGVEIDIVVLAVDAVIKCAFMVQGVILQVPGLGPVMPQPQCKRHPGIEDITGRDDVVPGADVPSAEIDHGTQGIVSGFYPSVIVQIFFGVNVDPDLQVVAYPQTRDTLETVEKIIVPRCIGDDENF